MILSIPACRRERNRATAVATHEKKKAREVALKAEVHYGAHTCLCCTLHAAVLYFSEKTCTVSHSDCKRKGLMHAC